MLEGAMSPERLPGAGCRVQGAGGRGQGAGCRGQWAGCRVQGAGCRVQGAGCRVQGAGCRVQGDRSGSNLACGSQWVSTRRLGLTPHGPLMFHCYLS